MKAFEILFTICSFGIIIQGCNLETHPPVTDKEQWESIKGTTLIIPDDTCGFSLDPIPKSPPLGFEIIYDDTIYNIFGANPYNFEEILYHVTIDTLPRRHLLYWANLFTGEKRLILDQGFPSGRAVWHRNGWITFPYYTYDLGTQVWVVKAGGDSLKRLTNEGINTEPSWSPDGNSIYFWNDKIDGTMEERIHHNVIDRTGKLLYSVDEIESFARFTWNPDKTLGVFDLSIVDSAILIDLNTFEETRFELPQYASIQGWHPNSKEITLNIGTGLYLYDVREQKVTFSYEEDCLNQVFVGFFISEDGRYGYSRRQVSKFLSDYEILFTTKVMWIDFETGEEYVVDLDL